MNEVDINQLQATVDAAIEQGKELMEERLAQTEEDATHIDPPNGL